MNGLSLWSKWHPADKYSFQCSFSLIVVFINIFQALCCCSYPEWLTITSKRCIHSFSFCFYSLIFILLRCKAKRGEIGQREAREARREVWEVKCKNHGRGNRLELKTDEREEERKWVEKGKKRRRVTGEKEKKSVEGQGARWKAGRLTRLGYKRWKRTERLKEDEIKVGGWKEGCLIRREDPRSAPHRGPAVRGLAEQALRHNWVTMLLKTQDHYILFMQTEMGRWNKLIYALRCLSDKNTKHCTQSDRHTHQELSLTLEDLDRVLRVRSN